MRLKDVPASPAYLVCHDHYDRGAMSIKLMPSFEEAKLLADKKQYDLDSTGDDGCHYAAYVKLPRCRVWNVYK